MKLLLAAVTAIAVFTANGWDISNEPEDQVPATEVKLFPDATKGQLLEKISVNGPEQDQQLEDNPRERQRRPKSRCLNKLYGTCRRRRKPCPGDLPSQMSNSKPYCGKFHRCCYRDLLDYKCYTPGMAWSNSICTSINTDTSTTLDECKMDCTESVGRECNAIQFDADISMCDLLKCTLPTGEPDQAGVISPATTACSIQQE